MGIRTEIEVPDVSPDTIDIVPPRSLTRSSMLTSLAFKGRFVLPATLQKLRRRGNARYNYYPDRMLLARETPVEQSISEYDCVFDTKRHWDGQADQYFRVRNRVFVAHGYDPDLHHPTELDERDQRKCS